MALTLTYTLEPNGVDESAPLIYCWEIYSPAGVVDYRYVGKSINGSHRPRIAYRLNVNRLLAGKPYRRGKPDGFRQVHRQLAEATRRDAPITLRLLGNVAPNEDIFERERHWQRELDVDSADADIGADSIEQRIAEAMIRAEVETMLGGPAAPGTALGMQFDGLSMEGRVLVEIWAHQGPPKPAQKNKVMTDALKLVHGDRALFDGAGRKILALADEDAAAPFLGATWMAAALASLGVEVVVVSVPSDMRARLRDAQRRQARGNR